eukprot:11859451-Alexandrium_andersonii.AAC.1
MACCCALARSPLARCPWIVAPDTRGDASGERVGIACGACVAVLHVCYCCTPRRALCRTAQLRS